MSRGINKVIIVGNCCADPETRYMPNGNAVTNISAATNEHWTDKQSGQKQERTEFHRVVFFNRLAEIAGEYLKKGAKVYIEGSLRTRKWQDQNTGQDRYTTEIVAGEMQMLDSRGDNQGGGQQYAPQQAPAQQQAPRQQYQQQAPQHQQNGGPVAQQQPQQSRQNPNGTQQSYAAPQQPPAGFDDFVDDIPFAPFGLPYDNCFIYCV